MAVDELDLDRYIASFSDFPEPGILFRDVSPLLASHDGMTAAIDAFAQRLADVKIDMVAGIESRGFLFSTLLAAHLSVGSLMVRKPGKLPGRLVRTRYALEYGEAELAIQQDAPIEGRSVLIVDDLLATGGTVAAAKSLLERCGAIVTACAVVVELAGLNGRAAVGVPVVALQSYD